MQYVRARPEARHTGGRRGDIVSPNAIDPRLSAPYRLYFWANENVDTHKGPHVHVESGDGYPSFGSIP